MTHPHADLVKLHGTCPVCGKDNAKKFIVTITETARYECEIEARGPYEACKKAEALFLKSISISDAQGDSFFTTEVLEREIDAKKKGAR